MNIRRAQPSESRELRDWIATRHYTKAAPPGYRFALEFTEGRERIGAMLLGRPASRELDEVKWLELTRMFFVDGTARFVESQGLAMMRRFVRVWVPQTRALLAYSDPSVGHEGTVYEADGWANFGRTRNGTQGWRNRPGRRETTGAPSRKFRWVRTP
jgi:hypothetical protein